MVNQRLVCVACEHPYVNPTTRGKRIVDWSITGIFTALMLLALGLSEGKAWMLPLLIPLNIWLTWRSHNRPKCPECGRREGIPADSPRGEKILGMR
jgi:hypothetical protein